MGQSQSSGRGAGEAVREEGKADYYDLLGVVKTATDEEIKKAYRKKALELHPDRNYGNVEASTALFAEVQSAYEVLSDPQERAWYDSHRDHILYGHDEETGGQYCYNTKMTTADDVLKLFRNFDPRMEFSDSPSGFFGALRETFEQLAKEEELACKWDGLHPVDYPSFGSRNDNYDDIRPFYSAWTGFATKKSFAWKDVYKYSTAPDRRTRRLMEKENRRLRDEAIREFNYSVRSLVAFVKKRDPRWKAGVQSESDRQKSLRDAAAAQAARSRAAYNAKLGVHVVPGWAQKNEDSDLGGEFSSESETEQVHYECVVCGKFFKSEKQMEAHERSKKHTKAVKQLQREMKAQDRQFQQESDPKPTDADSHPQYAIPPERADSPDDVFSLADDTSAPSRSKGDVFHDGEGPGPPSPGKDGVEETEDFESIDGDYAAHEVVEGRLATGIDRTPADDFTSDVENGFSTMSISNEPSDSTEPKIGKAKQKRVKKATQAATKETNSLKCAACQAAFPSKTKLFNHIKELGHAQPVPDTKSTRATGKKASRR